MKKITDNTKKIPTWAIRAVADRCKCTTEGVKLVLYGERGKNKTKLQHKVITKYNDLIKAYKK